MEQETVNVFVYGTLLSGEYNNYLLKGSEKIGNDFVSGFTMINLGAYPACVVNPSSATPILGEVWKVDMETFARLDRLEGYPGFYDRKEVDTFAGKAWMYCFLNDENKRIHSTREVITSGSWKEFMKERK